MSWCLFKRLNSGEVQERVGRNSGGMASILRIYKNLEIPPIDNIEIKIKKQAVTASMILAVSDNLDAR